MSEDSKIKMMLVDDHRRVHQVMTEMISFFDDIELLAHASNGLEAIDLCEQYQPHLILMDIMMPLMDGIEATKHIHEKYPDIKILAFSSFKDYRVVRRILDSGAVGYILKESSVEDIINTIRRAYTETGQSILLPEIMHDLFETEQFDTQIKLSTQEKEILKLFAKGMTNSEISSTLNVSLSSVKFHITNILSKLGVNTQSEALLIATKDNLL